MRTPPFAVLLILVITAGCRENNSQAEEHAARSNSATPPSSPKSGPTTNLEPRDTAVAADPPAPPPASARRLGGSDVYRINCQACHGPNGSGTPQAPTLTKFARALATGEGEGDLRRRLASGGEKMPAFPYLGEAEVRAVLGHLRELGGGPPAPDVAVAALSGSALGERIYRSNCASCHDASRTASSGMMCQPASLAGATERFSKQQVMNLLDVGVGPMPAFGHLSVPERDALWAYLGTIEGEPGARPTMGEMCPMVRSAMEGRPMGGMMRGRGGMMGRGKGMMGPGMMGGDMMRRGMGCPMMRSSSDDETPEPAERRAAESLPPCCR